ncbi:MAG: recombinase family protein [Clostridiales bacterium]|nr:recombinase family protein [Clostridiales bacterium]
MTAVTTNLKTYQAASYARRIFSDLVCPEDDDVTTLKQLEAIRGYLEVIPDVNHVYHLSDGLKQKHEKALASFERLVPLFENRTYDCLALYSLDRFAPTMDETSYLLLSVLPKFGVRILSFAEGYDSLSSGDAKNGFPILTKLINDASARDAARLTKRRFAGRKITGAHCPYGYLQAPDGSGNIVPDPESSHIVRRIFQEYISGRSISEIARGLTDDGIVTPTALKYQHGFRYKYGAPTAYWNGSTVKNVLLKSIYTGDLEFPSRRSNVYAAPEDLKTLASYPEQMIRGHHEALISHEDYETAQLILAAENTASKPHTPNAQRCAPNPYRNLLRCSKCGANMLYQQRVGAGGKIVMVYICSNGFHKGRSVCSREKTFFTDVDSQIRDALQAEILLTSTVKEQLEASSNTTGTDEASLQAQMDAHVQDVRKIAIQLSQLRTEYSSGALSAEEYYLRKEALDTESAEKSMILKSTIDQLRQCRSSHSPDKNLWYQLYHGYRLPEQMTLPVSKELIELATLSPEGKVTVTFKHEDEKAKLLADLHLEDTLIPPDTRKTEASA